MMRFELQTTAGPVEVSLDASTPHTRAPLVYRGAPQAIDELRRVLELEAGAFGHKLGAVTTPLDLGVALTSPRLASFAPRALEGLELLDAVTAASDPSAHT
ncbi:hypothetical protein L6R52_34435 [Myxococcota bacterium]|nr:hypothetical protein [Myxococcota bacterium]